jgi:hypothetical protein
MFVRFHPHALERMKERGAAEEEVKAAIEGGEQFSAQFGRTGFRRNFHFDRLWRSKHYQTKQIEVYAVQEDEGWLAITVITRFF